MHRAQVFLHVKLSYSFATSVFTSFLTKGTTVITAGKATIKALQNACSHTEIKCSTRPTLINVMTKDIKKLINKDIKKANVRNSYFFGIIFSP